MDRSIDTSAHPMQPENNDEPRRNPTLPNLTLQKTRRSRIQQEPHIIRIQAKRAARRNAILQVAQDAIMRTVDGQKAKYSADKGIVETAQLVYPWITQNKVYAKMRLLKHPRPLMIENTVDLRGGHPKGTTSAATRLLNERKRKAVNDVTLQYNELRNSAHGKGTVVKRGELQRVITTVLEESGLKVDAPSFTIAKDTVRSRVKAQTKLKKYFTGIVSPMAAVEPLLVQLYLQKDKMGHPLGIIEGLCFFQIGH